ncbi:MAG: ATP-binding cassette domain-containing protein [Chloroflexi bacterium]|nr:ATP-binding cassette domain-containing protein [Chloroflexota bacterium]
MAQYERRFALRPTEDAAMLIEVERLTKQFERRRPSRRPWDVLTRRSVPAPDSVIAVDDVTLGVSAGEVYGLLGPNGAGKTTMARMLATLLEPTAGTARIGGYDTQRDGGAVRARIGVMFAGERGVYWRLTGRENLEIFGRLQFMLGQLIQERSAALLEQLGLAERADDLVETYSTGMKQRLNLARTLLHDPPVLLLDEPTAALDPAAARATRELIRTLQGAGKAVLLTTHNMHEADEVCDRVGIIDHGRLVAEDRPAALIASAGVEPRLELQLHGDAAAARQILGADALWWGDVQGDGGIAVAVSAPGGWQSAERIAASLKAAGVTVIESRLREATLEDAFIKLTGSRLGGSLESI